MGVFDIVEILKINWKDISWNKSTYAQVKESIKYGCSKDFYHSMNSKEENQSFFKEFQSLNRKGIVAMIGTDGLRHTTLWNGNDFVDTALGISVNYLNDVTYLIRELF
ncbi:type VI secretion system amidase effector protein Tae4 [Campylobacter troglodytis]|uniref:type VI secretion system amidase effector protein Tae4 n=1 Tax=Campylobacter troglodytis TaxID=654363 RepID=UPI001FE3E5F3|nr:type VI secretion system amidase effector protein Tae4 [Campylobacter troglodytis]